MGFTVLLDRQLQPLVLHPQCKHLLDPPDQLLNRIAALFNGELARFNLGHVEDVVDQEELAFTGRQYAVQGSPSALRSLTVPPERHNSL